jgi:hypothetical protein
LPLSVTGAAMADASGEAAADADADGGALATVSVLLLLQAAAASNAMPANARNLRTYAPPARKRRTRNGT